MKLIVTAVDRHPFETQEPKLERIHLRPVVPEGEDTPCRDLVLSHCHSDLCAELQPGAEYELVRVPAPVPTPEA
jgi:hypothetical protein